MISLPEQGFFPTVTSLPKNINLESIRQRQKAKGKRQKAKGKRQKANLFPGLPTPYSLLPAPYSLLPLTQNYSTSPN
ncbi:MAG: hypothetical protein F6K55_09685 [Moorea sp. SIO4A3]|nr:hypothetical protein [Moorena sp. SIO4A3]